MFTFQTEQGIRTLVDEQLKNLGWHLTAGKNCNVFQEQPRTIEEKKRLKGKRPDYVLYSSDSSKKEPLIIIETKKPGANLDEAIEQGDEYAEELGAPIVFATDGVYYKTFHTRKHKPLFLNGEEVDELFRELEAIKFLENNEVNTISKEVIYDRKQLIKIFEDSNDLLRDEGFRAGIERFGEFSNILFLKLIGELEDLKEKNGEKFVLDKHLRWSSWKNKSGKDLLSYINKVVLPEIGESYEDKDIFTPLTIKSPNTLNKIIDKLDPLNLINIDSDIKGDAFEYFLKQSTATKNDLGEYFTPRHIVKVMVKLLNPQIGETIYDPFCGTGGTLIESFKHISHNMARTKANWKQLRENTLFGNEITTTARITKMNMILIGDGHSGIQQKNSLKNPIEDKYDIVVTNMPYSQKTEYGSFYDLPNANGDSICVQHCIKAIDKASENGRMALVVPEGFLFRKDLQKTREYLLDRCVLKSIISLPQGVFLPYTGVKTNILYCTDMKKKVKQDKFWYFDVKNDGYSLDNHRRKVEGDSDLQKFLEYRNPENQNQKDILKIGFSQISMEDVKSNDLILVGSRYKKIFDYENVEWEIVKIGNLFETTSGGTPLRSKNEYYLNGKIPWLKSGEVAQGEIYNTEEFITEAGLNKSSAKIFPIDTVLVAMYGATAGQVGLLKIEASTNQAICGIMPNKKVLPKYLYWILRSKYEELVSLSSGGAQPNISQKIIRDIQIPLPPIETQEVIVKELDGYQKVIDGARQIVENYKPNIEIKDSWEYEELSELATFQYGFTATAKNTGDTRYIRITDIDEYGKFRNEDIKYINKTKENQQYLVNKNDLFVARTGATFGKTAIFEESDSSIFASYLIRIKLDKKILPKFYWIFAQGESYWGQANKLAGGTGQPQFNANALKNIQIPLPSIKEQEIVIQKIESEERLIIPNIEIIKTFEKKIQEKLDFIWGK